MHLVKQTECAGASDSQEIHGKLNELFANVCLHSINGRFLSQMIDQNMLNVLKFDQYLTTFACGRHILHHGGKGIINSCINTGVLQT